MLVIIRKPGESICLYDNDKYNINIKLTYYTDDGAQLILQYILNKRILNFNLNFNKHFYLNNADIVNGGPYFFCGKTTVDCGGVKFLFNAPKSINIWREDIHKLRMKEGM